MGQFETNICRLCAGVSGHIPIYDDVGNKIDMKIKKCLPCVVIHENDDKPKQVCIACVSKLDVCCELIEHCLAAERRFDSMLQFPPHQESVPVKSTLLHDQQVDCSPCNCVWPEQMIKNSIQTVQLEQQDYEDSVIVLSKMDNLNSSHQEGAPGQDYVVMVELKYKDNVQLDTDEHISITANDQSDKVIPYRSSITRPRDDSIVSYNSDIREFPSNVTSFECLEGSETSEKDHTTVKLLQTEYSGISSSKECNVNKSNRPAVGDEKLFACSVCCKQFSRRTRLKSHTALHTELRPYACTDCDKSFITRWDLTSHHRVHSGAFSCEFCGKAFSVATKLQRHIRTHTGERPFSCKQCGKAFADKRNLLNHERTHSTFRPFQCPVCARSFKIRAHLTDHRRVHITETPFKCHSCSKAFKWKANYNAHIKTHKRDPVIV